MELIIGDVELITGDVELITGDVANAPVSDSLSTATKSDDEKGHRSARSPEILT